MSVGVVLCLLGALSFGVAACVAKVAQEKGCNAFSLVTSLFGWSCVLLLGRTIGSGIQFQMPTKVITVAVTFGICASVAFLAFQTSIAIGKVTVAWLMMNLSAGVPAIVSIWVYSEQFTLVKCIAYVIAFVALLFLFRGRRIEQQEEDEAGRTVRDGRHLMWFVLMIVILLTNGMSSFGLKVIASMPLPPSVKFPYLTIWYGAGFVSIALAGQLKRIKMRSIELGWGFALAILSIIGQVAMAIALDLGVPGNVVFPVTIGGSVLVVIVVGRLFFGEKMNREGTIGVGLGLAAVVMLTMT